MEPPISPLGKDPGEDDSRQAAQRVPARSVKTSARQRRSEVFADAYRDTTDEERDSDDESPHAGNNSFLKIGLLLNYFIVIGLS